MAEKASKLIFYELRGESNLIDEKNYMIENIDDYLEAYNITKGTLYNFRWFKHALTLTIKVDLSNVTLTDYSLSPTNSAKSFSYVAVQNYTMTENVYTYLDASPVYYFITHRRFVAEQTIEYTLKMDVLNTCKIEDQNSPYGYVFSPKTYILREHHDRFDPFPINTNTYLRKIHLKNEGLNPLIYNGTDNVVYQDNEDISWYLILRNTASIDATDKALNLVNPVKLLICADVKKNVYPPSKLIFDLSPTEYKYFLKTDFSDVRFFLDQVDEESLTLSFGTNIEVCKMYEINTDGIYVKFYKLDDDNNTLIETASYLCAKVEVSSGSSTNSYKVRTSTSDLYSYASINGLAVSTINLTQETCISLNSKDYNTGKFYIDRTDAQIIKIIKLPYRPFNFIGGNKLPRVIGWNSTYNMLEYIPERESSGAYSSSGSIYPSSSISWLKDYELVMSSITKTTLKDKKYESKLFSSEFYMPKFIYDSFVFDFHLEKMNPTTEFQIKNPVLEFKSAMNGASTFLFYFSAPFDKKINTYPNVLSITRNNELPLYNVAYLEYLKVGYNYDVKAKNLTLQKNIVGMGLQATGTIVSALTGSAGSLISGSFGLAGSVVNTIYNQISAQDQIERNLQSNANQGANISGCDDVELMSFYTEGNKAKIVFSEVSDTIKDLVWKLFFYTGYTTNEYKYPNFYSRTWFNFIQCNPIFDVTNSNITDEILSELKLKYQEGITFFHVNTISGVKTWDMEQKFENFETNLF